MLFFPSKKHVVQATEVASAASTAENCMRRGHKSTNCASEAMVSHSGFLRDSQTLWQTCACEP